MKSFVAAVVLFACASACRTEIKPLVRDEVVPKRVFTAPGECQVNDFTSATELPPGSKNLGWVEVKREEDDEATYKKLRDTICALGGDALSQLAWVRDAGEYEPSRLKANAWALP